MGPVSMWKPSRFAEPGHLNEQHSVRPSSPCWWRSCFPGPRRLSSSDIGIEGRENEAGAPPERSGGAPRFFPSSQPLPDHFAPRRVVVLEHEIERTQDRPKVGTREGHRLDRAEVEGAVRAYQVERRL